MLHYLIHFIAAKNLQLLEADNINQNLGVGDLRKKGSGKLALYGQYFILQVIPVAH